MLIWNMHFPFVNIFWNIIQIHLQNVLYMCIFIFVHMGVLYNAWKNKMKMQIPNEISCLNQPACAMEKKNNSSPSFCDCTFSSSSYNPAKCLCNLICICIFTVNMQDKSVKSCGWYMAGSFTEAIVKAACYWSDVTSSDTAEAAKFQLPWSWARIKNYNLCHKINHMIKI